MCAGVRALGGGGGAWGLGFKVLGSGFTVQGFRDWGLGFRLQGSGFRD